MNPLKALQALQDYWGVQDWEGREEGTGSGGQEAILHEVAHLATLGAPLPSFVVSRYMDWPAVQKHVARMIDLHSTTPRQNEAETLAAQLLCMRELGFVHSPDRWLKSNFFNLDDSVLPALFKRALTFPRVHRAAERIPHRLVRYAMRVEHRRGK